MSSFLAQGDITVTQVKSLLHREFGDILRSDDITYIISQLAGVSLTQQVLQPDMSLESSSRALIESLCEKLSENIPLAYALGFQEFYGRKFFLNAHTLIPRPESELIVDVSLDLMRNIIRTSPRERHTILECGTGSGCIGCTILAEYRASNTQENCEFILSDIQHFCLECARENALNILGHETVRTSMDFFESNLLVSLPKDKEYRIIVANLPYVASNHMAMLSLDAEPCIALEGSHIPHLHSHRGFSDGLEIIENLFLQSSVLPYIHTLVLEADPLQFDALHTMAMQYGYTSMKDIHDMHGYRRVFRCEKNH